MLPILNQIPIAREEQSRTVLEHSFSDFISVANQLEKSYTDLQSEVQRLRRELVRRSAALRASACETGQARKTLRQTLDALPCPVLISNPLKRRVRLVNPEAKKLFSCVTQDEQALWEVLPAGIRGPIKEKSREVEVSIQFAELRWFLARIAYLGPMVPNEDPEFIVTLQEITERKQAEAERDRARDLVALGTMSSVLAHEVRNPLASMELFAGLLESCESLAEEPRRWVQHLHLGIRSVSATVNNVLQFYTTGKLVRAPIPIDPEIRATMDLLRPVAEQRGVRLLYTNEARDAIVLASSTGLRQVLLNLYRNAIHHTESGGSVTCRVQSPRKGIIHACIEDTGCGINGSDLTRVFEAGYSASGRSVGLGLAVCKKIMDQHDASIQIRSRCGEGTVVTLEFKLL